MAETNSSASAPATSPPKKKSVFNFKHKAIKRTPKPTVEATLSPDQNEQDEEDNLGLFKRSKGFFPKFARQSSDRTSWKDEVKYEKYVVLPSPDDETPDSQKATAELENETPPSAKRRKLSPQHEDDDDIYGVSDEDEGKVRRTKKESTASPAKSKAITPARTPSASEMYSPATTPAITLGQSSRNKGKAPVVPYRLTSPRSGSGSGSYHTAPIELSDDDDEDVQATPSRGSRRATRFNGGNAALLADEEDTGVVGTAERSMTVQAEEESTQEDDDVVEAEDDPFLAKHYKEALRKKAASNPETPRTASEKKVYQGTIVDVLVTTMLWGLDKFPALKVRIRTSTPVKHILAAYIKYLLTKARVIRVVTQEEIDTLFLTYGGAKIYPSTTIGSLGLSFDDRGYLRGSSPAWSSEPREKENLNLVCWDEKIFGNYHIYRAEQKSGSGDQKEMEEGRDDEAGGDEADPQEEAKDNIRLVLKAGGGVEPLGLTAHPDTKVAQLILIFRRQRQIEPDRQVSLHWDGQRLDEDMTMDDAEVEDEDNLDVHID